MSFVTRYPIKEQPIAAPTPISRPNQPSEEVKYASTSNASRNRLQVTAEAAERAVQHLIARMASESGFDGADKDAMDLAEKLTISLMLELATLAHGYADISGRSIPNAKDTLVACEELGFSVSSLRAVVKKFAKRKKRKSASGGWKAPKIVVPPEAPQPEELLPSDSEDERPIEQEGTPSDSKSPQSKKNPGHYPKSLASLPGHFPRLPPKHTYLRTDPPAPTMTSLSSLQQKINNAAIIQDSLRNLIQATEAPPPPKPQALEDDVVQANQPVPPGLGGFVNWEAASGLRRPMPRWKV